MNIFNMIDRLRKVYTKDGIIYPLPTDPDGMPHPTNPTRIKATAKNGDAVWAHKPSLVRKHEFGLKDAYIKASEQKKYPPQTLDHIRTLAKKTLSCTDRGVIGSGTEPNAPFGYQELRLRHLLYALRGNEGYKIEPTQTGIKITAERHSKRNPGITIWHWDGKELISNGKKILKKS